MELMGYERLLTMPPKELVTWLDDNFDDTVPPYIHTTDDLNTAECLMSILTNKYSYLISMTSYAKISVREEKRKGKEFKEQHEDMIDRRDSIDDRAKVVLQQYNAVSRMVSVKQEIDKELNMNMR